MAVKADRGASDYNSSMANAAQNCKISKHRMQQIDQFLQGILQAGGRIKAEGYRKKSKVKLEGNPPYAKARPAKPLSSPARRNRSELA
jgi:hypothetical protein